MSLEQTIKDTLLSESVDLDARLQALVRAGLMPANTIPILRKSIAKVQSGMILQGAERDVMANFLNSMMYIVLGDDTIFNKAKVGVSAYAHHPYVKYATEETEVQEGENKEMKGKDPCWKGYEMVGTKKKGGREVPNCVPANEEVEQIDELSKDTLKSYLDKTETKPGEVVANTKDPVSMRKYTNRVVGGVRASTKVRKMTVKEEAEQIDERDEGKPGKNFAKIAAKAAKKYGSKEAGNRVAGAIRKKVLAKESRRAEALADIAAVTQMNESYRTTFNNALVQYGIKSPSELDEEKRKEFFNFVDQNYKKGDN